MNNGNKNPKSHGVVASAVAYSEEDWVYYKLYPNCFSLYLNKCIGKLRACQSKIKNWLVFKEKVCCRGVEPRTS